MTECAVMYLERWCNPPYFTNTFLQSMAKFPAGADHDYIHIMKGFEKKEPSPCIARHMQETGQKVQIFHVPDDRPALSVMTDVIRQLPHKKVLLFMSWSRILAPNWLKFYLDAFKVVPDCGIVGASSGWERRNLKDLSEPFPNVGIRTTGFMVDRLMFLEAVGGGIKERKDENDFEAGPNGLTKQIMAKGLKPVVVDRWGKVWHVAEWPVSKTFRSGFQEGLLVADNRTYDYAASKNKRRRWLAKINWGDQAVVPYASPWRRFNAWLDWHYRGR